MSKIYTIIVRKDTMVDDVDGYQTPCTSIVTLVGKKRMCRSREEAEKQRQVYHDMTQNALRKKYGDGFYHGLEIVEHDIHEQGEARIKWKKTDEPYTMDFFHRLCKVFEATGNDTFLLKTQMESDGEKHGKVKFMVLNIGRTADDKLSGSLDGRMHFDYIDGLRVYGWAAIMEEPEEK